MGKAFVTLSILPAVEETPPRPRRRDSRTVPSGDQRVTSSGQGEMRQADSARPHLRLSLNPSLSHARASAAQLRASP
jgi:hypothetical protein